MQALLIVAASAALLEEFADEIAEPKEEEDPPVSASNSSFVISRIFLSALNSLSTGLEEATIIRFSFTLSVSTILSSVILMLPSVTSALPVKEFSFPVEGSV